MSMDTKGIFRRNKKTIGYMLGNKEGKTLKILEVCCPRIEDIQPCIAALESKFKPQYITFDWMSRSCITDEFVRSGFTHFSKTWGVLMVNDLTGKQRNEQIRALYGLEEDKFQMTCIDEYWWRESTMPQLLAEFRRVLKNNGLLYISVRVGSGEKMLQNQYYFIPMAEDYRGIYQHPQWTPYYHPILRVCH